MTELPGWLPSLIRSLKLGYRASPSLIAVAFATTVAAAVPDALLALAFSLLATNIAMSAALLAVLAIGSWLLATVSTRANRRFADRAAIVMEEHVARLQSSVITMEHHERPDIMDRISVLREHAAALSELYQELFAALGALARLAITLGLLMSANPWFGLLGVVAVPAVLVSTWRADAERRAEEAGAQHDRLAKHLFELGTTPGPAKEIRVFGVQDKIAGLRREAWRKRHRPLARARWRTACWQSAAHALFGLAFLAAIASTVHEPPTLLLVLAAGGRLAQYVANTVQQTHFFRTIWLDVSRRLAWLEDYAAAQTRNANLQPPQRLAQGIHLENVTFRYPGTERSVLDDVTVTLAAGTTIAVVGENGAGKSTLVKLLCRLYEPTAGRILVDGVDLAAIDPVRWRDRVSGAFQDFFPFEYSAGESIGIGDLPRIDDPVALRTAVNRAGAGDAVPDLGRQLGVTWDKGVDLSHGQWQKVALARGFMRPDPLLLVLDEPTSALDAATEDALFERYGDAGGSGVTVLVSHRLATVRMADLILVLDGSRLVERGSHAELMAADGRYARLYRIQARAYGRTGS